MGGEGSGRPLSPATIVKRIYSSPPTISQPNNLTFPPVIHLKQEALKSTPETYLLNTGDVATGNYNFDSGTFFIDATNNNVGIGTTAPQGKLMISSDPTNTAQPTGFIPGAGDTHSGLFLSGSGNALNEKYGVQFGNYAGYGIAGIYSVMTSATSLTKGDLTFETKNDVADALLTERMRITSGGNVGINDTSPAEKLDVTGNINLTGVLKVDGVQVLKEQQAHIADAKTDYTTGDLDTEAEIITALNATNTKINAILLMLETHGLTASS